ncbi:3000_t:CDS:2 [Paraglomus brasilianum]|uniref:3000_t:CDS:1 n=1 Tax=Paraglomus brasilianum TaxID=144538 RepID=A0A9N9ASJ2_9GLOM|nr:3000_t:CDS:2 [Paraglomus brasilianum]
MSFITGKAIRSGDMERGHKGDGKGLSEDGHECFVMEISYAPQDQDRQKTSEDFY